VKKLIKALVLPAALVVCIAQLSWAVPPPVGGSMSGSVAEYNAAQVRDNIGVLTVPAGKVTYTANTAIPVGTYFNVTLPAGMQFTAPTLPTLTNSAATFTLVSSNGSTAKFQVATAAVAASSTVVLGGYTVRGAFALETVTPVANALPLTMQAVGIDPQPLPFPEFASDTGVQAVFVGAIQFIDLSPPSNGSEFGTGIDDTPLAVISAIAMSAEVVDPVTGSTPILSPNGGPNTLDEYDTATVMFPGALYANFTAFSSNTSDCLTSLTQGKVTSNAMVFPGIPINKEVFFCVKGTGPQPIQLLDFPGGGGYGVGAGPGFTTFELIPSHPSDDYLTSTNVNIEFPGLICYTYSHAGYPGQCINEYFNSLNPGGDANAGN
jgi:hypothetical protein